MPEPPQPSEISPTNDTSPAQGQTVPKSSNIPVPPSFPQKRRGRPPGRPNATVKEADYEDNTSVQRWNAAKVDNAIPAVAINIREALPESFLTRDTQQLIYKLPSREFIYFVQGWITSRQVASQRPSYVNGLLIHSRGQDSPTSCDQCAEKRGKNALGPFLTCRTLQGAFHNSCSNCKWFDTTSACSLYTGPKPNRKRKAKGGGGEDGVVVEGDVQDAAQNGTSVPPTAQEGVDATDGVTSIDTVVEGTDAPGLSLPQQNGDVPTIQGNSVDMPDGSDQEP
ncbi:hypothetical protein CONLIGDRAFT_504162 [Coniochaeta ligniaria NRRL 30616]|uniref:Uncharacterized protein n=1 Tax=Coniochaeta ligniaria NRRL 30616 TaxID=1408157 RepID=A0A1J7J9B6_9PEZI|nr:hypothetical protein CONLIGDRAFT_504162 [Coniochaeta ligniaria NRRL 30616]